MVCGGKAQNANAYGGGGDPTIPQALLTHLPLNPQPAQDGVSYRQTCLHFQQASYSEGTQTPGRDVEFLPLCPVKHTHNHQKWLLTIFFFTLNLL